MSNISTRSLLKLLVVICLCCFSRLCFSQMPVQPKFGTGTITEFKRFGNNVESHECTIGDEIHVTAKATVTNPEQQHVTFQLQAFIANDQVNPTQTVDSAQTNVTLAPNPNNTKAMSVDTSVNGPYVVPQNSPTEYKVSVVLTSKMNGVGGKILDSMLAFFDRL